MRRRPLIRTRTRTRTRTEIGALVLVAAAAVLPAGGCGTTAADCDPSRADFFSNTACLAGGGYAERRSDLRAELARERRLNREFTRVYAALGEEQAALAARRGAADERLGRLDRAWRDLQAELRRTHGENRELARRIDAIDREIAEQAGPADPVQVRSRQQERDDLKRRLELLQRELETGLYE
jgi:hypothetical protein